MIHLEIFFIRLIEIESGTIWKRKATNIVEEIDLKQKIPQLTCIEGSFEVTTKPQPFLSSFT